MNCLLKIYFTWNWLPFLTSLPVDSIISDQIDRNQRPQQNFPLTRLTCELLLHLLCWK